MSAPLIWIALPLLFAVVLFFLQTRRPLSIIISGIICFGLAAIALLMPISSVVKLGPLSLNIPSTLEILGRRFILENGDRTFLVVVYLAAGIWFLGSNVASAGRLFIPLGLAAAALLVAVMAVEPFLYAALLVEMAVIISVPMLSPPGRPFRQGVLRYMIFQSLAMPFILFAGWALAGIEANPSDLHLYGEAEVFLGLGFAFWLAVFPFYTWIPLLAEQSHPYVSGFILALLSTVILLLPLKFLDTFAWLRNSELLFAALRITGLIMVVTGGIWAAFQTNQARLMGYAVILENGFSLLALGISNTQGLGLYVQLFLPRLIAIAVWVLGLSILQQRDDHQGFSEINGLLRRSPLVAGACLLAYFSLGGLPLLAGFPPREVLIESLASQSLSMALWALIGNLGFLFGGVRALALMSAGQGPLKRSETFLQSVMLSAASLALIVFGLFPGWFLPAMLYLLAPFTRLK
jgi:NADH-quinone oxidoreductase subunit N